MDNGEDRPSCYYLSLCLYSTKPYTTTKRKEALRNNSSFLALHPSVIIRK
ncbi:hypothetical protein PALA111701_27725 [Paenibacillus lactis]